MSTQIQKFFKIFLKGIIIFPERLKKLRLEAGLTQKELANKLNITQQTYAQWESGRSKPRSKTLELFANFFNVSTDYLIGNTDTKDEEIQILLRGTLEGLNDEEKKQFEIEFKEFLKERDKLFEE